MDGRPQNKVSKEPTPKKQDQSRVRLTTNMTAGIAGIGEMNSITVGHTHTTLVCECVCVIRREAPFQRERGLKCNEPAGSPILKASLAPVSIFLTK
jgi:hypothetical protein